MSGETLDTPSSANIDGSSGAAGTEFNDNVFRVVDNADSTRKLAFNLGNVTSGNTRTFTVPDENATLGQTDFLDNVFRVSDESDNTKKIAFQLSGITSGQTRTLTMPDSNVDLGNITGATEFDDDVFRVQDNGDNTKKVAFDVSAVSTSTTRTITMPDTNINLTNVGQVDFEDAIFRISDDVDNTKKIAFQVSGISTGTVRTITMPDQDIDLGNIMINPEFSDTDFKIQDNDDATKEIAFQASSITSGQTRTITMPDADVDLSLIGGTEFSDSDFRIQDDGDTTKELAFEVSAITTSTTRTITVPDNDVDLADISKVDFSTSNFRISDNADTSKKVTFDISNISTGATRTIFMPDTDITLGQVDFEDDTFRISDQTDNSKKIAFQASGITTSTIRTITMPDSNVDLSLIGQVDFNDSVFRISDNSDTTKKIAFQTSNVSTGTVRTITMPDANVDLSLVGGSELADDTFRIVDDGDNTKKIAFQASLISSSTTRTITMPDSAIDLANVGQVDFSDSNFRISDNTDNTKKLAFEASGISTSTTRTITFRDSDLNLANITPDITDDVFRISDNSDSSKKIAFQASGITTSTVRTITVPDSDVDLSLIGSSEFDDSTFRVVDNSDNTKKIAFQASGITTSTVRTITMPDADVNLGDIGSTEFSDSVMRIADNSDATKKVAFEVSSITTGTTRTITMPDNDVDLGLVGGTGFTDSIFRITDDGDSTKKLAFEVSSITTSTTRTITMPDQNVDLERAYVLPDPTISSDPSNKNYVDIQLQGPETTLFSGNVSTENINQSEFVFDKDTSIRLATTVSLSSFSYSTGTLATISSTTNGALSIDGTSVAVDDVVLIKNQATLNQNGVYKVLRAGSGSTGWILIKMRLKTNDGDYTNGFITSAITTGVSNSGNRYILNTTSASLASPPIVDYNSEDQEWDDLASFLVNNSFSDIEYITNWTGTTHGTVSVVKSKTGPSDVFTSTTYVYNTPYMALSGTLAGSSIGGVAISPGDFILVDQQAALEENGIYEVIASGGSWNLQKTQPVSTFINPTSSPGGDFNYRNGMIVEVDSGSGSTFSGNTYILNTPSGSLNSSPTVYYVNDGSSSLPVTNTDDFVWSLFSENIDGDNIEEITDYFIASHSQDADTKTTATLTATYTGTNPAKLTASSNGAIGTIGGLSLSSGDQVLVADQTNANENGVYLVLFSGNANHPFVLGKRFPNTVGADYSNGQFVDINSGTFSGNSYMLATSTGLLASPPTVDYTSEDQTWEDYTSDKAELSSVGKVGENSVFFRRIYGDTIEIFHGDGTIGVDNFTKIITIDDSGFTINSGTLNYTSGEDFTVTQNIETDGNFISTTGILSIKESSPEGELHATETSGDTEFILENQSTTASESGKITFKRNRSDGVITSGDRLGAILPTGNDGSDNIGGARIRFESTGTIATNRVGGEIQFFTRTDSSSSTINQRLKINSEGNVGFNESSPEELLHITGGSEPTIIIEGQSTIVSESSEILIRRNRNDGVINSGDKAGRINFQGYDGSSNIDGARISVETTGTITTNRVGGIMKFFTHPDSTSSISEKMRIDENGNVGISTTSPNSKLHIADTGGNAEFIMQSSTSGTSQVSLGDTDDRDIGNILYNQTNNYMSFVANTSEIIRIINSGNVGINEITPAELLHITDDQINLLLESKSTTATDECNLTLRRTRNGGLISSGDNLGTILFKANDGSSNIDVASVEFDSTGTIALNRIGSIIKFNTHPDSASSITERMRIDENGFVGINTSNPSSELHFADISGNNELILQSSTTGTSQLSFGDSADTDIGSIKYSNSNNDMAFTVNTTEIMRLTSTGLGIKKTVPESLFHINDPTNNTRFIIEHQSTTATNSGRLVLSRNRSDGVVEIGDEIGQVNFQAEDTDNNDLVVAQISSTIPNLSTVDTNRVAGLLRFFTRTDSDPNSNEIIRIREDGKVGIGSTKTGLGNIFELSNEGPIDDVFMLIENQSSTATTQNEIIFRRNDTGGAITTGDSIGAIEALGDFEVPVPGPSESSRIQFDSTGTIDTNRVAGQIKFLTRSDSAGSIDEKMNIDETGGVNIGGASSADESSILELESTTTGFLFPKMTTTQRNNISSPKNGLIIFNTSLQKLQVYASGSWANMH